jgi:hypothetical protein
MAIYRMPTAHTSTEKTPFDKAATVDHYERITSERHDNTFNVLLDDLSKDW